MCHRRLTGGCEEHKAASLKEMTFWSIVEGTDHLTQLSSIGGTFASLPPENCRASR